MSCFKGEWFVSTYSDVSVKDLYSMRRYYQKFGLSIFGFGDMHDYFLNQHLIKKLSSYLAGDRLHPIAFDSMSFAMNRPEYIDYFIDSNLSLEDVKVSKIYGNVHPLNLTSKIGYEFMNESSSFYGVKNHDKDLFFTDRLKSSFSPVVLYSCGFQYILDELDFNGFEMGKKLFKKQYDNRYYYLYSNLLNKEVVFKLIDKVKHNIEHIFSINPNAKIFVFGCELPYSFVNVEEFNLLRELFGDYNLLLMNLCNQYHITYVSSQSKDMNDMISVIMNGLSMQINSSYSHQYSFDDVGFENFSGVDKMVLLVQHDYREALDKAGDSYGFEKDRNVDLASSMLKTRRVFDCVKRYHSVNDVRKKMVKKRIV